jgi:hypothetical protein
MNIEASEYSKAYNAARDQMAKRFREFEDRFIALQSDFPEFLVTYWNHCDFLDALVHVQSNVHDCLYMAHRPGDPEVGDFRFRAPKDMTHFCTFMTDRLNDEFDAECGFNWHLLYGIADDYDGELED